MSADGRTVLCAAFEVYQCELVQDAEKFAAKTIDGALAKELFAKLGIEKSVQENEIARKKCCAIRRFV